MALARALVNRPKVLLLDEPLSALDANLRVEMQRELKLLQRELGITFLFVTHDQSEALAISDRVVLLHRGESSSADLRGKSTPGRVPPTSASFLGKSNLVQGTVRRGIADCGIFSVPVRCSDGPALFSLRPEAIASSFGRPATASCSFERRVVAEQFHGANSLLTSAMCERC